MIQQGLRGDVEGWRSRGLRFWKLPAQIMAVRRALEVGSA